MSNSKLDLLRLIAVRGRPEVERMKLVCSSMKDPNRSSKNIEQGFRSSLKRQYKKSI